MASKMPLRMKPVSFSMASHRTFSSFATTTLRGPKTPVVARQVQFLPRQPLQRSFRRTYAENAAPSVTLSPTPKPKKRFRFLRWTWRVTWLSTCFGVGYLGYQVWFDRNPNEQFDPDPNKKTLVILGE
jgi:NADH:ubiquinone reductase (non-electrogenic)